VAIEAMKFIAPVLMMDLISIYATVERVGTTSMAIRIDVIATRDRGKKEVKVTEGLFTFVALDEDHRPRPIPPE
jgi:acyl-CoA thioesterase YciA